MEQIKSVAQLSQHHPRLPYQKVYQNHSIHPFVYPIIELTTQQSQNTNILIIHCQCVQTLLVSENACASICTARNISFCGMHSIVLMQASP